MEKDSFVSFLRGVFLQKIGELQNSIDGVQQSANQESKSSMGDKYETGRAMAQNEVFLLNTQLKTLFEEQGKFELLSIEKHSCKVAAGSLVQLSFGWFFLGCGLGKVIFDKVVVMCISLEAPLYKEILGKTTGEKFIVNGREALILNIL